MIEQVLVQATLLISVLIFVGLSFTHLYAGHKIKGLMLAALGILISAVGYVTIFLLPNVPIYIFLSNVLLVLGTMLFYLSTFYVIEEKPNYLESVAIFLIYILMLAIFVFIVKEITVRQTIVSVAIIYVSARVVGLLYNRIQARHRNYLYSYLVLSIVLIVLQTIRLFLIALGINNDIIEPAGLTANIYILIFTGLIFVVLAFVLVIATSVYTKKQLLIERKLLEEWSNTDYLTKLPNRRRLFEHLDELLESSVKFAVVITDINGFKAINDTFGHPVGDAVLIAYAEKISAKKGPDNFVARFGGDEFVIVFSDYNSEEEITSKIATSFHLSNLIVSDKKYDFAIKSSAGVALFPEDGVEPGELINKADHALYEVKMNHQNHVGFYKKKIL